jgi:hypothetical protein
MKREVDEKVQPGTVSADVQQYFTNHVGEFNRPLEVRVAEVVVKDRDRADTIATRARELRRVDRGNDVVSFRNLVIKYTEDPKLRATSISIVSRARVTRNGEEIPVFPPKSTRWWPHGPDEAGPSAQPARIFFNPANEAWTLWNGVRPSG